jgi:site-specific DNA-methyltransferase (adenine-specific)
MSEAALVLPPPTSTAALPRVLAELPKIVARLVAEGTPREVLDARHKAETLRSYAKKAGLAKEAADTAAEARLRLERRLGELIPGVVPKGRPRKIESHDTFRLADLNISPDLSSRCQANAQIPEKLFEAYFPEARAAGWDITWGGNTGLLYRAECAGIDDLHRHRGARRDKTRKSGLYNEQMRGSLDAGRLKYDTYHNQEKLNAGKVGLYNGPDRARLDEGRHPGPREHYHNGRLRGPIGGRPPFAGMPPRKPGTDRAPRLHLHYGDCLDVLPTIAGQSVDLILTDLPYALHGNTTHRWCRPLDLTALWVQYRRIIKPNHAVILFGTQPYSSTIVASAPDWFKYEIIWVKRRAADFVHAYNRPMRLHENILVFSSGAVSSETRSSRRMPYYPQTAKLEDDRYPRSVVHFPTDEGGIHPMQKPVALLRWLIDLYTLPGQMVLDSCMGSGSTGVAALGLGRSFIGVEKHAPFFEAAQTRLNQEFQRIPGSPGSQREYQAGNSEAAD